MRRLRWPLIALSFLVLLGFAFALRKPRDAFAALKRYTIAEDISYEDLRFVGSVSPSSSLSAPVAAGVENHVYYVKGISEPELLKILQERASQLNVLKVEPAGTPFAFLAMPTKPNFNSLHAYKGPFGAAMQGPPPQTEFTVVEHLALTRWDVRWLQIRMMRKDPFSISTRTYPHPR